MIEPFSYFYYRIRKIFCLFDEEPRSYRYSPIFDMSITFIFTAIVTLIKNEFASEMECLAILICSILLYFYFSRIENKIVEYYDTISLDKHKRIIGNVVFAFEIIAIIMSFVVFYVYIERSRG